MTAKTNTLILVVAAIAIPYTASLVAQGTLAPSEAPGPTMKTIDQIEPRTDVATLPGDANSMHRIISPGSYFLSGNLDVTKANGIVIASGGVTLDLGGFTIFRSDRRGPTASRSLSAGANRRISSSRTARSEAESPTMRARQAARSADQDSTMVSFRPALSSAVPG